MRFLIITAICALAFVVIEFQILGIHEQRRKDKCELVVDNGIYHKATGYEYYTCLNGDRP